MTTVKCTSLTPQQCEICESRSGLLRCGGCQVAYYCNGDPNQRLHWNGHKRACLATKKARTRLSKEETSLRNNPGDGFMLPPRVFEEHAGHFWGIYDTRDYMRARYDFVDIMLEKFPRHQVAVQTAVSHLMDMLRLNRGDNMGLRNVVPALMLRLGSDQDAYDFVKWWATCDPHGDYDWGDMELPHLDTRDADALEEPKWWSGRFLDLSHASTVMLIKLRILLRLRDLQNTARALQASTLPIEIVDQVRWELLGDSLLAGRRALATSDTTTLAAMIARVRKQIWALYTAVRDANLSFWTVLCLMRDEAVEVERPDAYSPGSPEEANLMALYNYPAWEETPGALDELGAIWLSHRNITESYDFDGHRFLRMRQTPGKENQAHFVTTGPDSLGFGHGQHACPGGLRMRLRSSCAICF
ncbi:hypothetical protein diail_11244 [Diaporthe ilicicola]|nr:hypothetical protein diail_11244 [Diaporthe ilicicola]